jgi:hypothetical protein
MQVRIEREKMLAGELYNALDPDLVSDRYNQGWGRGAGQSSAAMPGYWRTGASRCAMTGSASSSIRCSKPPAYSWLQGASPANSENVAEDGVGA